MKTIQISIPDSLAGFIKKQAASNGYADESAFVIALLQQAKEDVLQQELECQLLEAVESLDRGEGQPVTELWDNLRDRIREKYIKV